MFVAADTFVRAAETQAALLPIDPQRVFVAAPVASRTRAEIDRMAEDAFDAIVAALTGGDGPEEESRG